MLELGKAGSSGVGKGVLPVLRDGVVVATLQASSWTESATAVLGDRRWVFGKRKGVLTARWEVDPEETARLRAEQTSWWKGTWTVELTGGALQVESVSWWKGTHRFLADGREVARGGTTGGWSPRPTLTVDVELPLDEQVFLLWLLLVVGRRNQAAALTGTGVTVTGGSS
ncbi:hypothetical protein A6V29_12875 [Blastococcus sp. CCUG 61487]|nr:hypothetical protein A6V29_12875 [Blastococcus sp. CCUG 61487]